METAIKEIILNEFRSFCEKEFKADFSHEYIYGRGSNYKMNERVKVFADNLSEKIIETLT